MTLEPLEGRALLAVTAVLSGGDLEIAYNAAGDLVADISSDGTNYTVSGTGLAPTQFPIGAGGVTGRILVADNASLAGQTFTVNAGTDLANPLQVNPNVEATSLVGGIATAVAGNIGIGSPVISLANNISTSWVGATVTLSGAVTLGGDVAVRSRSGAVTFAGTVDGAYTLVVRAVTVLQQDIGGTRPLTSLEIAGGQDVFISATTVRTTGDQLYSGRIGLNSSTPSRTVVLEAAVARILKGLSGFRNALIIRGDADFGGGVEIATNVETLGGLTVTGDTSIDWVEFANGTTVFEGAVSLQSEFGATFSGFSIGSQGLRFASTVVGAGKKLDINIASGDVVFDGSVGTAAEPLADLVVSTLSTTREFGDIVINAPLYAESIGLLANGTLEGGAGNEIHAPEGIVLYAGEDIGPTTPLSVDSAWGVSATASRGDMRLQSSGHLMVAGDPDRGGGLVAAGTVDLQAAGDIIVPGGLRILGAAGVAANKPIRWQVNQTSGRIPGTLENVINNANVADVPGSIEFVDPSGFYRVAATLPSITTSLIVDGAGTATIAGGGQAAQGFTFAEGSAGGGLKDLSLRGFRNFGIRLVNSPGVTVSNVSVTSMNIATSMGLYATGDLAGTVIESSLFTGGLRGALLVNARNLAFGMIGRGNTFYNNRPVPGSQYSGTGIRAQGNLAGTVVAGNTFNWNNYGFAFINARNIRVENNLFTRNRIAAIFVEGNNRGSSLAGSTYGTGTARNARIFRRIRGSSGI